MGDRLRSSRAVPVRLACALLVDDHGRVLLQERDDQAPFAPNQWGMPGGHVEAEETFDVAVYRELEEETGLRLESGHLVLWRSEEFPAHDDLGVFHVYIGRLEGVGDDDIVVGEGRQIVFVAPEAIAGLDLASTARHFVLGFLDSEEYRRLAAFAPPSSTDVGTEP